jgi:hypothetical protein
MPSHVLRPAVPLVPRWCRGSQSSKPHHRCWSRRTTKPGQRSRRSWYGPLVLSVSHVPATYLGCLQLEIARWTGPEVIRATLLDKVRDVIKTELEASMSQAPAERPQPARLTRKAQKLADAAAPSIAAGPGDDDAPDAAAAEEEEDPMVHATAAAVPWRHNIVPAGIYARGHNCTRRALLHTTHARLSGGTWGHGEQSPAGTCVPHPAATIRLTCHVTPVSPPNPSALAIHHDL